MKDRETDKPANTKQVGGDHYQTQGVQHWDYCWAKFGRGYFQGNISKYVERYHAKNGVEDLHKAQHYLTKLIELEEREAAINPSENYVNQDKL